MSITNNGNQLITFGYKQKAQADNWNQLIDKLNNCGIYSGFQITKDTNTNIVVSPGSAVITDGTNTIKVETTEDTDKPIAVLDSSTPYVVLRWEFLYVKNNYADFMVVATPLENDIVLGRLKFVGNDIVGVDYSYRSFANVLEENIIVSNTYNTTNELAVNPSTNFWYIGDDGYTIEYKQYTQKTIIDTLTVTNSYYIYYDGTDLLYTDTITGLYYCYEKIGWYDSSENKILALIDYDNSTLIITPNTIYNKPESTSIISNLDTKLDKSTNVQSIDGSGIADGEICIYNLTDKKIKTSNVLISTDTTLSSDSDTNIPTEHAVKTYVDMNGIADIKGPGGFILNGKITPTVTSNNLTVALKTLADADPSASDPIYIRVGGEVRTITSALSVTKNAGTNWCNAGSAELATYEVDFFVYIGYNTTDGVTIGFSRISNGTLYSSFSSITTNDRYCAISTITNATATDNYMNIGRFAATLSAGAGYTWTVPTYTSFNLIQRPIYETRELQYLSTFTGFSSLATYVYYYKVVSDLCYVWFYSFSGSSTSNATTATATLPFLAIRTFYSGGFGGMGFDNGAWCDLNSQITGNSKVATFYKGPGLGAFTNSGRKELFTYGYYIIANS